MSSLFYYLNYLDNLDLYKYFSKLVSETLLA